MPSNKPVQPVRARLDELATIRGGYVGPDATTDRPGPSRVRALKAGDIAPDGGIAWPTLRYAQPIRDGGRYLVTEGDVLLPLRSVRLRAVVARDVPAGIIAAGHWALLSPNPSTIESEFLAWYLNHSRTRVRLSLLAQGTNLQFLSLNAVRDFEVDVPSLDVQRSIARVNGLNARLTELEHQLTNARSLLVDALSMDALHGAIAPTETKA